MSRRDVVRLCPEPPYPRGWPSALYAPTLLTVILLACRGHGRSAPPPPPAPTISLVIESPSTWSTPRVSCTDYGRALCEKEAECLPAALRQVFGALAVCAERMKLFCRLAVPERARVWSSEACVAAIRALTCDAFDGPESIPACMPPPPTFDWDCSFDDQCKNGRCFDDKDFGVQGRQDCDGICDPADPKSLICGLESYDARSAVLGFPPKMERCPAGRFCGADHLCLPISGEELHCNWADPCLPLDHCVRGDDRPKAADMVPWTPRCRLPDDREEGAPCRDEFPNECNRQKLLRCVEGRCQAPAFAKVGDACDVTGIAGPICEASGICDPSAHVCLPHLEEGTRFQGTSDGARDRYWRPGCMPPARFAGNECRIRERRCQSVTSPPAVVTSGGADAGNAGPHRR